MRVLFVDDEPSVLSGLRRMLRPHRDRFESVFAPSGPDALAVMVESAVDVIVTDMRMPGMDGAQLLEIVRDRHPDTVRIVLSGQVEESSTARLAVLAHQFLNKPCEVELLIDTIDRALGIRARFVDPELRRVLGRLDALPSPRPTLQRLSASLGRGDASADDVIGIVRDDPAMTVKVLQLVNSAFFSLPRHVADVREAVVYLGLGMIRDLLAAADVFHAFEDDDRIDRATYEQIRSGCLRAAQIAGELSGGLPEACLTGMLHDVGLLALAVCLPDELARNVEVACTTEQPLHAIEAATLGATHADIGAYLLTLWGFRDEIVEAVAYHHDPAGLRDVASLAHLTYVAAALANEGDPASERLLVERPVELDGEYLARVNLAGPVAAWRAANTNHSSSREPTRTSGGTR